jgi:hypothetical protein
MRLWVVESSPHFALDAGRNLYTTDGEGVWYANGAQLAEGDALIPPGLGEEPRFYETPADFLNDDPQRLRSPERDYGVFWRQGGSNWVTHRVSYVFATGEIYVVANAGPHVGRVELLGICPAEDCAECDGAGAASDPLDAYCRACGGTGMSTEAVERALAGWDVHCGTPGSLEWLRERLVACRVAA